MSLHSFFCPGCGARFTVDVTAEATDDDLGGLAECGCGERMSDQGDPDAAPEELTIEIERERSTL